MDTNNTMEYRIGLEKQNKNDDQVTELILDNCRASHISGLTDEFVNLETLSLNNVGLTTLEGFPRLPKLKKLELSDNRLAGGLNLLHGSPNLQHLNISGNQIKDFDALEPLKEFRDLISLGLDNCEVTEVADYRKKVFELIPNLQTLDGSDKKQVEINSDDENEDDEDDGDEDDEDDGDEDDEEEEERDDKDANDKDADDKDENDEDEDEEDNRMAPSNSIVYDFDIMMAKKKQENSLKRRRRGYEIINDSDDMIAAIINQMRDAVEADNEANKNRRAATNKLKLLPFVTNQLRKIDLRDAFIESDVLSVLSEWLMPLPDRSLPHLNIRENLLKILIGFNLYDVDRIKSSGIGKAIMYLYKHPKETRENKQRAKQLISSWSRPIFNLDSNFSAISREEREERDKELQRRARRPESSDNDDTSEPRPPKKPKEDPTLAASKPGDKGWIPRARVPAPSMRDYVIRPRSKVDGDIGKGTKRPTNMLEKLMKTHQERRRASKQQRAVNMKIDKL